MAGAIPVIGTQRFGTTLKIDYNIDTLMPGEGSRWLTPGNSHPSVPVMPDISSPFVAMSYTLVLDGVTGDRVVGGVYQADHPSLRLGQWLWTYDQGNTSTTTMQGLQVAPVVVRVIPSPAGATLVLAAVALCTKRRRIPARGRPNSL